MESTGLDLNTVSITLLLLGVVALAVFIYLARRRALPATEIWLIGILVLLSFYLAPRLIMVMTSGRGDPSETLPWTILLSLAVAFGWLFWRTRPSSGRPPQRKARSPQTQEGPPRPEPTQTGTPPSVKTVFICYRRNDSADVTGRLYDRLLKEFGRKYVYKDVDTIPIGVDFREHINALITRCDVLLAIIGRHWLESAGADNRRRLDDAQDPVRIEIATALRRGIPVVPVLVGGSSIPDADALPEDIAGLAFRNGTQVRPDPDFHRDMDRLITGIKGENHPER